MDDASPLTIILPTYNRRGLLQKALASCYAQTDQRFRLLVIDNASTDGTAKDLAALEGRPGVRIMRNEQNLGSTVSINTALAAVGTPWVTILCDDDQLDADFVRVALDAAARTASDLVVLGFSTEDGQGKLVSRQGMAAATMDRNAALAALVAGHVPTAGVSSFLFRVPGFQFPLYPKGYFADSRLVFEAALKNGVTTTPGHHYRRLVWPGAESHPTVDNLQMYFEALIAFRKDMRELMRASDLPKGLRHAFDNPVPLRRLVRYIGMTVATTSSLSRADLERFEATATKHDPGYLRHVRALSVLRAVGVLHPRTERWRRRLSDRLQGN